MAEKTYLKNINLGGVVYGLGITSDDLYAELGISKERFVELLSRDFYCPTLSAAPASDTLTYLDADGSTNHFQTGQPCRWKDSEGQWRIAFMKDNTGDVASWYILPVAMSELENDVDMATNASVDSKVASAKTELTTNINTVNSNLTTKINKVNTDLTATINSVKTSLEASMETHRQEVADTQDAHEEAVDTRLTDMQVEFETLITEHRDYMYGKLDDMQATVDESNAAATEAERVSYEASATATQAKEDAAAAKAAVATLEGLANTTTAQQTLAAQVTQIEANKQGLLVVPNFELVKETEYDL